MAVNTNEEVFIMTKDLFIIDTGCSLNKTISEAFMEHGYETYVASGFDGTDQRFDGDSVPDDILKQAEGFIAICIFVNKKIAPEQIEILKANGNKLILCCSAGFDNIPLECNICKKNFNYSELVRNLRFFAFFYLEVSAESANILRFLKSSV